MKTTKRIVLLATILAGIREIHSASAQVQQAWVAHSRDAGGNMIKVDSAGNVYRNGFKTAKYDANGNELWAIRFPGNAGAALALDGTGHVYVAGDTQLDTSIDYMTVKYDAEGNELWVARYDGPVGDHDYAKAIAVDSAGNAYVTGWSGLPDYSDYATVKYDANLNQVWVARYDGPGSGYDFAAALAVDSAGNVYVTGSSSGEYLTVKYDTHGNQLWTGRYTEFGASYAVALAVDSAGNVYVTGSSSGVNSCDYVTLKYDANGNQLWAARYNNGPGSTQDDATALAVDTAGNVYVAGTTRLPDSVFDFTSANFDYVTVKYDANGNQLWTARFIRLGRTFSGNPLLAVDSAGNAYISGESIGSDGSDDYVIVKYDPSGNELWVARYNGAGGTHDWAFALTVDGSGAVYVTGESVSDTTILDSATIKYVQTEVTGPPVIAVQPQVPSVQLGTNILLTVSASGTPPLRYQWCRNRTAIEGATNSVLRLLQLQPPAAGDYTVVVTNLFGAVTSAVARLSFAPVITVEPQSGNLCPGFNYINSVVAVGAEPLSYQWQFNGLPLAGETSPVLVITGAPSAAGDYCVVITNGFGSVTSAVANLIMSAPPAILQPPLSQSVVVGGTVTFSVMASGTMPLTYRWRRPGPIFTTNVLDETISFLTVTHVQTTNAGTYGVIVFNRCGDASKSMALTVLADNDRDGMADTWETTHGLNTNDVSDALLDSDGDGMTNLHEYLAGTDPHEPQSYLKVDRVTTSLGLANLQFSAVSNKTYTVQYRESFSTGDWLKLTDMAAHATNWTATATDSNPNPGRRFYRVVTPRQP